MRGLRLRSFRLCAAFTSRGLYLAADPWDCPCEPAIEILAAPPDLVTPRLFTPDALIAGDTFELDAASAHHAVRVLRLGAGAAVELFDGAGQAASASLVSTQPCTVRVDKLLAPDPAPSLRLTLAQCISAADKMDWTIEKAVELGVTTIVPLQSQKAIVKLNLERGAKRREHWHRLILAASSQSRQNRVPRLHEVTRLEDWLRQALAAEPAVLRLILDPRAQQSLSGLLRVQEASAPPYGEASFPDQPRRKGVLQDIEILCGPESGFTPAEFAGACAAGWLPVGLGPRVLRTETAGLAALTVLQAWGGDLR